MKLWPKKKWAIYTHFYIDDVEHDKVIKHYKLIESTFWFKSSADDMASRMNVKYFLMYGRKNVEFRVEPIEVKS